MTELLQYLPFLISILLIEWGLAIAALVHILRHKTYRCGNRALWIIVSLFVGIIGLPHILGHFSPMRLSL